jgi:flagellar biosynthesis/type III secretory pathway protein FliH
MSASARRLSSSVETNRFAWQSTPLVPDPAVRLLLQSESAPTHAIVSPMRDLPSPAAERLDLVEREAYARGHADGERAMAAELTAREDATAARLATAIQALADVRAALMHRSERDLVRLAVSMAERVLRREIDIDRQALIAMARLAIDRLGSYTSATVHLNPDDYERITASQSVDLGKSVELLADPSVGSGGCVVRSPLGMIDMGIDAQVKELSLALLGDDSPQALEEADGPTPGA